jgi:hypothetical protein
MPRDQSLTHRKVPDAPAGPTTRPEAVVIRFPARTNRPARLAPTVGEARGEVVLFLGVRYERLAS